MVTPRKGKADYLALGDWNTQCWECARKYKASELIRHWQGYYVCRRCWEPRHPQDFVRGLPDVQTPPWTQPVPAYVFVPIPWFTAFTEEVDTLEAIAKSFVKNITPILGSNAIDDFALNGIVLNGTDNSIAYPDNVSISEVVLRTFGRPVVESLGITEIVSKTLTRSFTDSIPVSESVRFLETETTLESLGLVEAYGFTSIKVITESIPLTENVAKNTTRPVSDSISLAETSTRTGGKTSTESFSLSELSSFKTSKVVSEPVSVAETVSVSLLSGMVLDGAAINSITLG